MHWKVYSQTCKYTIILKNSTKWRVVFTIKGLAPVVQEVDNALHWKNPYPLDNAMGFPNTYPLDSDLSGG